MNYDALTIHAFGGMVAASIGLIVEMRGLLSRRQAMAGAVGCGIFAILPALTFLAGL